ncbi:hypothetical protein O181_009565 [Austropuccinia psidii MF-1]|uniref:Uncharacterized protein n=1 Tax=Austropuccinia psidii MF-1 TaxID=1389203 RepID=A0A9Q3BRI7_9BASI|nr:hypothetical protein [Austropuccinia psidii MF-1]
MQFPGAQQTITEVINQAKIQDIITTPEVEPINSNLKTNLSEEELIQTQEALYLVKVIKNLDFMELQMNRNTASTGIENSQIIPLLIFHPVLD